MLLGSLGTSAVPVGLPDLAVTFRVPVSTVQWVLVAYLLSATAFAVTAGRLGDAHGRRRMLLGGIAVFAVASAACSAAPTFGWLLAARAAQGLGAAFMTVLGLACVADMVPKDRTAHAMGWMTTLSAVGTALGPALAGHGIAVAGWRGLFMAMVPLAIGALLTVRRWVPADEGASGQAHAGVDVLGMVLLILGVGCHALAMTFGRAGPTARNGMFLAGALAAAAAFVWAQKRAAAPHIPVVHLRDRALCGALAANALVSTVIMATLVVGPFYLSRGLFLETGFMGWLLAVGPAVAALSGLVAGRLVVRLGAGRSGLAGLAALGAGSLLLAGLPSGGGAMRFVTAVACMTCGYAVFQAANQTAVMGRLGPSHRGVAAGLLSLSRNIGLVTGASLMGAVFAQGTAVDLSVADPMAITRGVRSAFGLAAGCVALAAAALVANAWGRGRRP